MLKGIVFEWETIHRPNFGLYKDVQKVLPEVISKAEKDSTLGVRYTEVIPLLVASIKELKALVDTQATEIAELKAKVG